jgi:formate hydrogenlyase subunit 6/NADH:ubiquinone oxidoreductase subunit I
MKVAILHTYLVFHHNLTQGSRNHSFIRMEGNSKHPIYCREASAWYLATRSCIACEVCVYVCPINLLVIDWKLRKNKKKEKKRSYSIDFGVSIMVNKTTLKFTNLLG